MESKTLDEQAEEIAEKILSAAVGYPVISVAMACWMVFYSIAKEMPHISHSLAITNLRSAAQHCADLGIPISEAMPHFLAGFGEDSEGGNA